MEKMDKLEYEDDTIPQHVAAHYRQVARERATRLLEVAYSKAKKMDNDEMREIEPGQNFPGYQFLR